MPPKIKIIKKSSPENEEANESLLAESNEQPQTIQEPQPKPSPQPIQPAFNFEEYIKKQNEQTEQMRKELEELRAKTIKPPREKKPRTETQIKQFEQARLKRYEKARENSNKKKQEISKIITLKEEKDKFEQYIKNQYKEIELREKKQQRTTSPLPLPPRHTSPLQSPAPIAIRQPTPPHTPPTTRKITFVG